MVRISTKLTISKLNHLTPSMGIIRPRVLTSTPHNGHRHPCESLPINWCIFIPYAPSISPLTLTSCIQYTQPKKREIVRNISHGRFQLARTNVYLFKESRRLCHLTQEALIALLPLYVQKLAGDICGFVVSTGLCSVALPAFFLSTVINLGMMTRHLCKIYNWLQEMERRGLEINLEWSRLIWRAFVGVAIKIIAILLTLNRQELIFALDFLADLFCEVAQTLFPGSDLCGKAVFNTLYELIHDLNLDKIHHAWERINKEIRSLINRFDLSPSEAEKTEPITKVLMTDAANTQQQYGGVENALLAHEEADHHFSGKNAKGVVKENIKHAAKDQVYKTAFEDPANEVYDELEKSSWWAMWFKNSGVLAGWAPLLARFYLDKTGTASRGWRKEGGKNGIRGEWAGVGLIFASIS